MRDDLGGKPEHREVTSTSFRECGERNSPVISLNGSGVWILGPTWQPSTRHVTPLQGNMKPNFKFYSVTRPSVPTLTWTKWSGKNNTNVAL